MLHDGTAQHVPAHWAHNRFVAGASVDNLLLIVHVNVECAEQLHKRCMICCRWEQVRGPSGTSNNCSTTSDWYKGCISYPIHVHGVFGNAAGCSLAAWCVVGPGPGDCQAAVGVTVSSSSHLDGPWLDVTGLRASENSKANKHSQTQRFAGGAMLLLSLGVNQLLVVKCDPANPGKFCSRYCTYNLDSTLLRLRRYAALQLRSVAICLCCCCCGW